MKKKFAFTLSELLISLAIVGTIAAFVIPPLMSEVHTKVYLNLLKNMSVTLEQLAADQLLNVRAHSLSDTDFGSASDLLTTKHFAVVRSGDAILSSKYKNFKNEETTIAGIDGRSVLLKNGVVLVYIPATEKGKITGTFIMDANGNDDPNVIGKDLFMFDITKKGKLTPNLSDSDITLENCSKGNAKACYGYVVNNGWKYPD